MILIADTETTGIDENREVIELAWLQIDEITPLNVVDQFRQLYKPSKEISLGAMATHHIIEDDLVDCPPSSEAKLPENAQAFGINLPPHSKCLENQAKTPLGEREELYLIGHNIDFDWEGLKKPDCKRICTLAMARHTWPDLETHKLGALIYHLMEHKDARHWLKNAHSALTDCVMTAYLAERIVEAQGITTIEQLYAFSESSRIPLKMTFGKHYNMPINQLPASYRTWLLNLPDLDPYLRIALN